MSNAELARILRHIALYLQMKNENVFKIRAYENAAQTIESLPQDVFDIYARGGRKALDALPAIGKSIAEKIEEYVTTGKIAYYEDLKKKIPIDLAAFEGIEGIGPKRILTLYKKLKIRNADELARAAAAGKIRRLAGFGEKTEQNILTNIELMKKSAGRMPLYRADSLVHAIEQQLAPHAKKLAVAGSYRRRKETIGDIDILAVTSNPKKIMDAFTAMRGVVAVYGKGPTKATVHLDAGIDADLRVVPPKSFGAALNYFTGSKDHNVALRKIAIAKGYKLNEYGVFKGTKQIAGATEEDVYTILGLPYVEPELRENTGEIEAAKQRKLPNVIGYDDLHGDLQVQTSWSDGSATIEVMARAAQAHGFSYMLVTDHTRSLAMTGGLDEKKLARQGKEIDRVNAKLDGFIVLKGAEVNIMKDGSLDIADHALKELDVVGVSVHSHFALSRADMTKRIIAAIENPHVDILFHPTGRIVGRRKPYELDMEAVIDAARRTSTVMEVNALERLDLKDEHVRMAVNAGVTLAIDSDAHSPRDFAALPFGIAQARRGWAQKKDVINAWTLEKMKAMLK